MTPIRVGWWFANSSGQANSVSSGDSAQGASAGRPNRARTPREAKGSSTGGQPAELMAKPGSSGLAAEQLLSKSRTGMAGNLPHLWQFSVN